MATTSFVRSKSGDRFYNPPARRQLNEINQKNQQICNQFFQRRRKSPGPAPVPETPVESDSSKVSSSTNFNRFMKCTTPLVPAQHFPKTSMKGRRTQEDEYRPYFVLGDLWDSFKEWSAYGAGVPLLLDEDESVVQYYVPYLSAIQLYINKPKTFLGSRRPGEESDESRETSSEGSSDSETERGLNSFASWRKQEVAKSNLLGMKGLSLQVKPLSGSGSGSSTKDVLMFEFFEHDPPFTREPLIDKISLLAPHFPALRTYRSYELSSSSWVSVAWYPIYRIPTGHTIQNPDSAFLTYHSLSTPVKGWQNERQCLFGSRPSYFPNDFNMAAAKLPLPIFGMSYYKFKISMWSQDGVDESQKVDSLFQAADNWLKRLKVYHPDYRFFITNIKR